MLYGQVGTPMQIDRLKRREFIALMGGAAFRQGLREHGYTQG